LPTVDPGDYFTLTQPPLLGGGPVADVDDLCALHVPVVGLAGVDADGGVPDLPLGQQFGRDVPDVIDRDREAESDRPARLGEDRRVDPDHRAARVDERTAGVAGVDGGVGLDGVDDDIAVGRGLPERDGTLRGGDYPAG